MPFWETLDNRLRREESDRVKYPELEVGTYNEIAEVDAFSRARNEPVSQFGRDTEDAQVRLGFSPEEVTEIETSQFPPRIPGISTGLGGDIGGFTGIGGPEPDQRFGRRPPVIPQFGPEPPSRFEGLPTTPLQTSVEFAGQPFIGDLPLPLIEAQFRVLTTPADQELNPADISLIEQFTPDLQERAILAAEGLQTAERDIQGGMRGGEQFAQAAFGGPGAGRPAGLGELAVQSFLQPAAAVGQAIDVVTGLPVRTAIRQGPQILTDPGQAFREQLELEREGGLGFGLEESALFKGLGAIPGIRADLFGTDLSVFDITAGTVDLLADLGLVFSLAKAPTALARAAPRITAGAVGEAATEAALRQADPTLLSREAGELPRGAIIPRNTAPAAFIEPPRIPETIRFYRGEKATDVGAPLTRTGQVTFTTNRQLAESMARQTDEVVTYVDVPIGEFERFLFALSIVFHPAGRQNRPPAQG